MTQSTVSSIESNISPSPATPAVTREQAALPHGLNQADLETVLAAWQNATDRLQNTHELLRREIARLTDELEQKNRELARQNRLADLGRMAAHIAHEVRNSLMPMTLYVSLLQRKIESDHEASRIVGQIQSGFVGLETTVSDLLSFTSDRDPDRSDVWPGEIVNEVITSLLPQLESHNVTTSVEVPEDIRLSVDPGMFRRALLNLVLNAIDAMSDGGRLTLIADCQESAILFHVQDSGEGIPSDVLGRLFDPFVTSKSEGTGLGLAIVERIMSAHDGEVSAANREDGGAVFTLRFPLSDEGAC